MIGVGMAMGRGMGLGMAIMPAELLPSPPLHAPRHALFRRFSRRSEGCSVSFLLFLHFHGKLTDNFRKLRSS